jgi:hypothetical protein
MNDESTAPPVETHSSHSIAQAGAGILILAILTLFAPSALALEGFPFSREDPSHIVGAKACGECHDYEFEAWSRTRHFASFKDLHKRKRATQIARRLGFKRGVKRDTRCLTCHFTSEIHVDGKREIAKAGVSCESCHGAALKWKNIHNDDSIPREKRLAQSRKLGMRPPSDVYAVVSNCFQCHIVAFEDLVNQGEHTTGTSGFEIGEFSDKIRHNFLASRKSDQGPVNQEASIEHQRVLYVTGAVLQTEYALRALAQATTEGAFLAESIERAESAIEELAEIASESRDRRLQAMSDAASGVTLGLGQSKKLLRVADQLSREMKGFLGDRPDELNLAWADVLRSGGEEEGGEEEDDELDSTALVDTPTQGQGQSVPTGPGPPTSNDGALPPKASGRTSPAPKTSPAKSAPTRVSAKGLTRRVRGAQLRSGHATVGNSCGKSGCHVEEKKTWKKMKHAKSADRLLKGNPKAVKIASALGINSARLKTGDNPCMACHGTVETKRVKRTVKDGVSCQSCHGAGEKFIKPHQDGDDAGYALGMNRLADVNVRGQLCSGCHYINYEPLLAVGHPTGEDFDFKASIKKIKHWERSQPDANAQLAAFKAAVSKRGGVPKVKLVDLAAISTAPTSKPPRTSDSGSGTSDSGRRPPRNPSTARPSPQKARKPARVEEPRGRRPGTGALAKIESADVELPEWTDEDERGTIDLEMRILQARMKQIYEAIVGGSRR